MDVDPNGEIAENDLDKSFSEQTTQIISRLRAYAERSQSIAGELCAEAAKHIEEIYKQPKPLNQKLQSYWIKKAVSKLAVQQGMVDINQQVAKSAAQDLATHILATQAMVIEQDNDHDPDNYSFTFKCELAIPPDPSKAPPPFPGYDDMVKQALRQHQQQSIYQQQLAQQQAQNTNPYGIGTNQGAWPQQYQGALVGGLGVAGGIGNLMNYPAGTLTTTNVPFTAYSGPTTTMAAPPSNVTSAMAAFTPGKAIRVDDLDLLPDSP